MEWQNITKEKIIRDHLIASTIEELTWEYDFINNRFCTSSGAREFLGYDNCKVEENFDFWTTLIHPDDVLLVQEAIEEQRRGSNPVFDARYRVQTKGNCYKWVVSRGKTYYEDGRAVFMAGYHLSLEPIKVMKENEQKFQFLFNNISDAVFIIDAGPDNRGRIVEVNDNAVTLTGFSREELLARNINDIKPEEMHGQMAEITRELSRNEFYVFDTLLVSKDNRIIPVEANCRQVDLNGDKVNISVVRDLSDRIRTEEALRESEERSRKIVELSPSGAFMHSEGIISYINDTGVKLLGAKSKEDIIGKPVIDFIHKDYRELAAGSMVTVKEGASVQPVDIKFIRTDGSIMYAEVATAPMIVKGNTQALSYVKDISEHKRVLEEKQKLLEQTLEYDRIKTEFFSNISHELRTPLNIILSSTQLLNAVYENIDGSTERFLNTYEKYIGVMKQNSYRLLKLINNIIDLTRLDTGFLKIQTTNRNLVETLENITESVIPYVEAKGLSLTFDTDIEEKLIAFDEDKIERILLNLLSNATKFTRPGGSIDVSISDRGNSVLLTVKDTGCGIPENKLGIIFERFRQVDSLLTRRAEGSGIGLSLVKALVEAHGGTIEAKSALGKGSEFIISLPVKVVENEIAVDLVQELIKSDENKIERINIEFSDI